jgi:hypothetical protein
MKIRIQRSVVAGTSGSVHLIDVKVAVSIHASVSQLPTPPLYCDDIGTAVR